MRWLNVLGLLLVVPCGLAGAQSAGRITGHVTDASTHLPLADVTISVDGTTLGSVSGADGRFEVAGVPAGPHQVAARRIGFAAQQRTVTVTGDEAVVADFALEATATQLTGVVVVGYGTQRKVDVTGAVSTVDSTLLQSRPITQASQALEGLAPGVYVNQSTGQPARDRASIRIRGVGTLGVSDPLILIDGVEGDLSKLNPQDIQSISVLKDAASASIYGSRGANGVVLVTTKTGAEIDGVHMNYDVYTGVSTPTILPENVSNSVEWMEMANTALANEGKPTRFSQAVIDEYRANSGSDPRLYPNTDWIDVMFGPAPIREHNLRIAGGNQLVKFSLSGGLLDNAGVLKGNSAERGTIRLNLEAQASPRLKIGTRLNASRWSWKEGPLGNRWTVYETLRAAPFYPKTAPNGDVYPVSWIPNYRGDYRDPLAMATASQLPEENTQFGGQVFGAFTILPQLVWNTTLAVDRTEDFTQYFVPTLQLQDTKTGQLRQMDLQGPRRASNDFQNSYHRTVFSTLTYDRSILEQHHVNAMLGYSWEADEGRGLTASREGFPSNSLTSINAGSLNQLNSGTSWDWGLISTFGRLNYDLQDKYLFQANFRYDGSSRFAAAHRWGLFPSFSAGWRLSEEPFLRNVAYLHDLKLRGSWGKLGNQNIVGPNSLYPYQSLITLGTNYNFGNQIAPGVAVTSLVNEDISWEKTTTTDLGLDATVGRFDGSLDYFNKSTDGIIRPTDLPWFVGALNPPYANLASVQNRGWEGALRYHASFRGLTYGIGGNISQVANKVTRLPGDSVIGQFSVLKVGQPIDAWYVLQADGIYQTQQEIDNSAVYDNRRDLVRPGDIRYRDINGDGVINSADRVIAGSRIPKWTYGFNVDANFRGFDFATLLQGVGGVKTYPSAEGEQPFYGDASVTTEWRGAWTPQNPTNKLPRLTTASYAPNFAYSTFWLRDASYLRVKNVQLGYTLPATLTQRAGVTRIRFYVNAQNALTFTDLKNVDPERAISDNFIRDVPNVRILSVGTNIGF